jgi:hypothetical protein
MAKQTEHGKLLAAAAKLALEPIGCRRKGQSRIWLSDERSWIIVVEFQPSGFSRGSYLNVAPMWLWRLLDVPGLSFDYGPVRVANYVEFCNEKQFTTEADVLAKRAAAEVLSLRQLFNSPAAITRCLIKDAENGSLWQWYHAAVAAGLMGQTNVSLEMFARVIQLRPAPGTEWVPDVQNRSAALVSKLPDIKAFRATVVEMVQRTRANHKLPNDPACLEGWPS